MALSTTSEKDLLIDRIVDFIIKYSYYTDRKKIKEVILDHLKYKTCDVVFDKDGEIMAVARWNIKGAVAEILDVIIHPKYRGRIKLLKWLLARNLVRFPGVLFLKWERQEKYPYRRGKVCSIKRFLNIKEDKYGRK